MPNSNEYMRVYMLDRYHKRRQEAIMFLGGFCVYCGSDFDLQIDHTNWRNKSFSISKLWSISKIKYYAELEKCQVLCRDCHHAKTRIDMREIKKERGGANQYGRY